MPLNTTIQLGVSSYFKSIILLSVTWIITNSGIEQNMIQILLVLSVIDVLTGMLKGMLFKDLKSSTWIAGILSKMLIVIIPISLGLVLNLSGIGGNNLLSWFIVLLAFAELYSIISNMIELRTGKKLPEFDAITFALSSLLDIIRKTILKIQGKK